MMGGEVLELELFAGVLETGLKDLKLSLVPPSLDQVLVGSTDRTRSGAVKHLFLIGVNEGIMPAALQEEGVLSDQERLRLAEIGLELAPGVARKLLDERFLIYGALTLPSRSLWISYAAADEDGGALLPSEVIRHVRRISRICGNSLLARRRQPLPNPGAGPARMKHSCSTCRGPGRRCPR
ncbi:hypothetical protein HMSSN036_95510 [Paenibacillus macerans]|nr:hypothetical protein HMSSN036_95510 [Paenibacillus macerans]